MTSIIYSIYKITNLINDKIYIGFTSKGEKRFKQHIKASEKIYNTDTAILNAIRKHGKDNFIFEIIYQSLDKNFCKNIMEPFFIKEFNTNIKINGYNMTCGGDGGPGVTSEFAKENNKKQLDAKTHYWLSDKCKDENSKRMKSNNPMHDKNTVEKAIKSLITTTSLKIENGTHVTQRPEWAINIKKRMQEWPKRKIYLYIRDLYFLLEMKTPRATHSMNDKTLQSKINVLEKTISGNYISSGNFCTVF